MRKSNTQPLKNVIKEYIEALGHRKKIKEVNLISNWEKIMGKPIARHTTNLYIKDKTIYISLDSSVLRNELLMRRESIISHLNEYAGEPVINKIIFR